MIPPAIAASSHGWCTGSLSLPLVDGTPSLVYNPYSLSKLSAGVAETLECLIASSSSFDACSAKAAASMNTLAALTAQNVHPVAVWSACKSNFFSKVWDVGAGALYIADPPSACTNSLLQARTKRTGVSLWSPRVLECLSTPSHLYVGYSECLTLHVGEDRSYGLVDAYFQYVKPDSPPRIPDACIAFSGLAQGATGSLQSAASACQVFQSVP